MNILFQGDSVTDCGRDRTDPMALGNGYVRDAAAILTAGNANVTVYNRGMGGNRVRDLVARWDEDCLALKPDVLSILIAINDVWRQFDSGLAFDLAEVKGQYRELLDRVAGQTKKLILLEPFLIPTNPEKAIYRTILDPTIGMVRELAVEYGAALVPLDGLFAVACTWQPPAFWAADGIHPTPEGHRLIADAWLETFEKMNRPEKPATHFHQLTKSL